MGERIPFRRPTRRARLDRLSPEARRELLDRAVDWLAKMEADPSIVGVALIGLCDDGQRRQMWECTKGGAVQMERQVRRVAAEIARKARTCWDE